MRIQERVAATICAGALLGMTTGCGSANFQAGRVSGTVSAPSGQLAAAAPGMVQRLAAWFVGRAWALTGVDAVGAGVEVRLERIDAQGNVTRQLTSTSTDSSGGYFFGLATDEVPDSSLEVSVGDGDTLMRSFVSGESIPIDSATEATVRLVLASGDPLAHFSADELASIQAEVDRATADVAAGTSVAETNGKAEQRAGDDPGVRAAIDTAGQS